MGTRFELKLNHFVLSIRTYYSNALPNPWTVVIKSLNTIVAYGTMRCTRRPIKQTSVTVLDFYYMTIYSHVFCPRDFQMWGSSIDPFHGWCSHVVWFIWLKRPWISRQYSRISTGSQDEKHQILHIVYLACDFLIQTKSAVWFMNNENALIWHTSFHLSS